MGITKWGELYWVKDERPFINATIVELNGLVSTLKELELGPVRVYEQPHRDDRDNSWDELWVSRAGLSLQALAIKLPYTTPRVQSDVILKGSKLRNALKQYRVGIGDFTKVAGQIKAVDVLRQLLEQAQRDRLKHDVQINRHVQLLANPCLIRFDPDKHWAANAGTPVCITLDRIVECNLTLEDVLKVKERLDAKVE